MQRVTVAAGTVRGGGDKPTRHAEKQRWARHCLAPPDLLAILKAGSHSARQGVTTSHDSTHSMARGSTSVPALVNSPGPT
jgi:hypothetical protein